MFDQIGLSIDPLRTFLVVSPKKTDKNKKSTKCKALYEMTRMQWTSKRILLRNVASTEERTGKWFRCTDDIDVGEISSFILYQPPPPTPSTSPTTSIQPDSRFVLLLLEQWSALIKVNECHVCNCHYKNRINPKSCKNKEPTKVTLRYSIKVILPKFHS